MYKLEIVEECDEVAIVQYVDRQMTLGTKGRRILIRKPLEEEWQLYAKFPFVWEDLFAWNRLASRVLRIEKCIICPTRSGKFLGIRKGRVYDVSARHARELFSIQGRAPLPRGITSSIDGEIFFGEYFSNKERGPVNIWAVKPDLLSYRRAHTFPANCVRHVHGLYSDPHEPGRIWVTTGDLNGECHIYYSDDGFKSMERIGDGTQLWRAVSLMFTENTVCWFTDTNLDYNFFVELDRTTMEATALFDVDNSTLYSCRTADGYYLAASVVEAGDFTKSNSAVIRVSKDCRDWRRVASYEKDGYSPVYFGFGAISFPSGTFESGNIWVSGKGLRGFDGFSRLLSLKEDA